MNHELVLVRLYFKDKIEKMTERHMRLGQAVRLRIEEEEAVYYVGLSMPVKVLSTPIFRVAIWQRNNITNCDGINEV